MKLKSLLLCLLFIGAITQASAQESADKILEKAFTQAKKKRKMFSSCIMLPGANGARRWKTIWKLKPSSHFLTKTM